MHHGLILRRALSRTHVALIENGHATEIYSEPDNVPGALGNIYCGRVVRVLPGMQAAFVDLRLGRTAFLYVDDIAPLADPAQPQRPAPTDAPAHRRAPSGAIADYVRQGQAVVVQVRKEPLGDKGARVTTRIALTGRFVVLMPQAKHIAISQKITDGATRDRLTQLLAPLRDSHGGLVARTQAAEADDDAIASEVAALAKRWQRIAHAAQQSSRPRLLYSEPQAAVRAVRELYVPAMEAVAVNDEALAELLADEVRQIAPDKAHTVTLWSPAPPGMAGLVAGDLWLSHRIDRTRHQALTRDVPLPGGGALVIEACEALTVIDVNSGKFVGKGSVAATMTQLNVAAAQAIARELRLRNVGGIVVIDFVDLSHAGGRAEVVAALTTAMAKDRAKHQILPMSPLGLVQLTRRRVRPSLLESACTPCPYCTGNKVVRSVQEMAEAILSALYAQLSKEASAELLVNAHPLVATYLTDDGQGALADLQSAMATDVLVVSRLGMHQERFEILDMMVPGFVQSHDLRPN